MPSRRVQFPGGNGFDLGGIIDAPDGNILAAGVFTHCFTCNKDLKAIVRISRSLAAAGFLVLRYDLTGLGNSQGDFSQTNFSTNLLDLQAAVDYLSREGWPPSFLVGHSFGGACSLASAAEFASVQAVVSLAAPSDTSHLASLLNKMDPEIEVKGIGSVTIGGRDYAIRKQMLDDFRVHNLPGLLAQLSKPVLLMHSPEDETLGFEHALRLYSLLTQRDTEQYPPSPASLVCLPGADHLLVKNAADLPLVANLAAVWLERYATA